MPSPLFNLVLLNPEIPNNTGNIGRTAMATGCRLHVIHPIGFDMSEKARRRAGLDYWSLVDCVEHESWEQFLEKEGIILPSHFGRGVGGEGIPQPCTTSSSPSPCPLPGGEGSKRHASIVNQQSSITTPSLWLYTTRSSRPHWEASFSRGDYMLFGRETKGVPEEIHEWVRREFGSDHLVTLPMVELPSARSLNLATAVCAAVYEGMRQVRMKVLP